MEPFINSLLSNKILLTILILLISLIIYLILKRILKIIIIIIISLVLYLGYIHYKGENVDETLRKYINSCEKELIDMHKKKDKIDDVIDSVNRLSK